MGYMEIHIATAQDMIRDGNLARLRSRPGEALETKEQR
jgi:hypothetical protein